MKLIKAIASAAILAGFSSYAAANSTLDAVKQKGFVQCGASTGIAGFSIADSKGNWTGIDVDACRAIAAAIFGDANKFKITPLTTQQRFTALQSGEIDVLTRNTTATVTRDTTLGLMSTGTNYYDSQGVMVKKSLGVNSAKELDGAAVCVQPGTTTELNLADWFRAQGIKFNPVVINNPEEAMRSFTSGRCDAFTTDKSGLASMRASQGSPDDFIILPEDFSKEPLGPMVRQGDDEWFALVRWTLNAMLEAEEYGINSQNVDEQLKSDNPNIQRVLGVSGEMGKGLKVDNKWAYNIIKQVGNYGESFDRNLGMQTPLKLERGLNAQWRDGGLMYGWPVR
ncbi:amino acid ABC transporter substrate-binding protein [Alcaligenes endophyticus]|uniref:Amino acid ABC transporter substrate-binding protein n=1 Tax=Alcaligenes endophyticus TaxID=1929088 RepID=A0ABT8ELW5_9BURK|nr:amino acid ABC transporter substrate-binding protein [Alcaligenes endophyticus]MCX5591159.1 amino acid ABC transporter substrate-binding protein [Alcaligenes endophyticus]MDN4122263.1 amino acid ABC transporter substrate-binding protein [Alcaligenes endophyticus]